MKKIRPKYDPNLKYSPIYSPYFENKVHIMGVVNVTPDSFSDGGDFYNKINAIDHGLRLLDEGADILDVGGESTRPGAQAIEIKEEIERIVPVIQELSKHTSHISIDTRNAETMRRALDAGATYINDISALGYDPQSLHVVSEANCPVFAMHSLGKPDSMQRNPIYNNVVDDILQYFKERLAVFETHSIDIKKVIIDPGIGFGKTLEHNLSILCNINRFFDLECPLLIGTSRKSFIAKASNSEEEGERLPGSLASALWCMSQGVQFFRVHDVKETRQALDIYSQISQAS